MMLNEFYVYCLLRPDGRPFYVGKGNRDRWLDHEKQSRNDGSHKANIIAKARRDGLKISRIKLAEGLSEIEAFFLERAVIAAIGREPNGLLTNKTDGGEGVVGHKHSEATRAVMALAKQGKVSPKRGIPLTAATLEKLSKALKGRVSPNKGKRMSDEQKAKLSAAHKGKTLTEEHKKAIGRGVFASPSNNKGRVFTPEQRTRMSAAHMKKPANKEGLMLQ